MRCINWGAVLTTSSSRAAWASEDQSPDDQGRQRTRRPRRRSGCGEIPRSAKLVIKALPEWAEAGKIRPNVSHRLPLEDYAKAMRLLIDRKAIGRVALMMG